jgi:hypothetical protein
MAITAVTTITIDGQSIALPGGYSTLDTTEAQQPGFETGKVLAIVADTVGGEPQKLLSFNSLAAVKQAFLFSPLATDLKYNAALMARIAYNASDDDRINGTFDRIVFVKPGRDTAAVGTLQGTSGALASLQANDYGAHTNQFGYQIGLGTNGGVSVYLVGGSYMTQSGDDIGADAVIQISYTGQADDMTVVIDPDAVSPAPKFKMVFDHDEAGLEGTEIVAGWTAAVADVASTSTLDKAMVTVYGISGGVPAAETVTLDGTTKTTTTSFTKVTGVRVHGMTIGTVTVADQIPLTVATFAPTVVDITGSADNIQVKSSSSSDSGYSCQLYGKDAGGADLSETVVINGTTVVTTANKFSLLLTVKIIGTTVGTVTVQDTTPVTLVTIAAGTDPSAGLDNTAGLHPFDPALEAKSTIAYVQTGGPSDFIIRGKNSAGVAASELASLASGTTTTTWSEVSHIELGAVPNATGTIAIQGTWYQADDVTMDELETGIELQNDASVVSLNGDRKTSEMDKYTGTTVKSLTVDFYSQTQDVIDFINAGLIMTATRTAGATGLPVITASTVLLTGGSTVAATNADIDAAMEVLKEDTAIRVMVPAYIDQSVHLLAKAWADNRALPTSKAEARVFVGLDPTTATKQAIKNLTVALNNGRVIPTVQRNSYYDDKGILQTGDSIAMALTLGGLRAAAEVGEPGTWKYIQAVGVSNDGAWTPEADGDELVRSGLNVVQKITGRGYRIIRSVTSYQKRKDRIRTEESSMESADESARDLRTYIEEQLTGVKNNLVTADTVRNMVEDRLGTAGSPGTGQIGAGLITAWRNVTVVLVGDVFVIDYEVAPVEPVNFIKLQAHVFTVVQAA